MGGNDEARARINTLLAEQHLAAQMTHVNDRAKYIAAAIEILRLAKVADLSADWKPPAPLPVREHIDSLEKLSAARLRRVNLARRREALMAAPAHTRSVADDDQIQIIRSELELLDRDIKIASLMEGTTA